MSWKRIRRGEPCPICGNVKPWCSITDDGRTVRCMRVMSDRESPGSDGQIGWLHAADGSQAAIGCTPVSSPTIDATAIHLRCVADLSNDSLGRLSRQLGLKPWTLRAMGLGWYAKWSCYTFPMLDWQLRIVGLRTRHADGEKRCITGSHGGMFVPRQGVPDGVTLLLPEGPTDAAACLQLGYYAIGRPQALWQPTELIRLMPKTTRLVVVGENDKPDKHGRRAGLSGANRLLRDLRKAGYTARMIFPPAGAKDIRDWLRQGATRADVDRVIG